MILYHKSPRPAALFAARRQKTMQEKSPPINARVVAAPISAPAEWARLQALAAARHAGALAMFVGVMRGDEAKKLFLEHYPAMTQPALQDIAQTAAARWGLAAAQIVHRVGEMRGGEEIVFVGVASRHRRAAFDACAYIADFLKSRAPFWKKETAANGEARWVEARAEDEAAIEKWKA